MSREAARIPGPDDPPAFCLWLRLPPPETPVFPCLMELEVGPSLTFSGGAPPTGRGCNGAPAQHYLTGGARESGGAADRSALCLGMAGPPRSLGKRLSQLMSMRAGLLAPGGQRTALSASSGANFLFGRENRKDSWQEMAFFLHPLFCWPWFVGKDTKRGGGSHGWVSPLHPSLSEPRRGPWAFLP